MAIADCTHIAVFNECLDAANFWIEPRPLKIWYELLRYIGVVKRE